MRRNIVSRRRTSRPAERVAVRELLRDRPFLLALVFSLVAHGSLFVLLSGNRPLEQGRKIPAYMMARLVHPQDRSRKSTPVEENSGALPGGEKIPPDPPVEAVRHPEPEKEIPVPQPQQETTSLRKDTADESAEETPSIASEQIRTTPVPARSTRAIPASAVRVETAPTPPAVEPLAGISIPSQTPARVQEEIPDTGGSLMEIRRRIESQKTYPLLARRNGWEGDVVVEIQFDGIGGVKEVQLLRESGYRVLDEATLSAVHRAVPFPVLPGRVQVPVTYRLR